MSQQSHSHFHNDNLVSEAGVPIVKTEPSSANSVTHVAAGRVSHRPGVAGVAPALPSTSGQGTLKSATLPSSSAGKTQVSCRGGGGPAEYSGMVESNSHACSRYLIWADGPSVQGLLG